MALDHQKRGRARRSFRDAAWWRAPIDIRKSLTEPPPDDREMLGHPERNRAEPLGSPASRMSESRSSRTRIMTWPWRRPARQADRMERLDLKRWPRRHSLIDARERPHGGGRRQHNQRPTVPQQPSVSTGLRVSAEATRSARSRARPLGNPWTVDCRKPLRCVAGVLPDGR